MTEHVDNPKPARRVDPIAERRKALATGFFNGTDFVAWDEATIEDHEARIVYLNRRRGWVNAEAIQKSRDAIRALQDGGAR